MKRFIGSRLFFILTLGLFTVQASWIALSARYPMAFDEAYHIGLIKLHATQWSPIFLHQPPGMAPQGAITRDPSYLFQWLMSFVYRWLNHAQVSFMNQIIIMRLINVAMFAVGLFLFWLVLRKTKASKVAINLSVLFFTLIPVTILMAATINYDNLLMPCIAGCLLLMLNFREQLLTKKRFNSALLLWLLVLGCLSSLVVFPFLPIFAGIVAYVVFLLWRTKKRPWRKDWHQLAVWHKVVLGIALVISLGLFTYTYGANVVLYQNPIPQCGQVLGNERCQAYGPWARNYHASLNKMNAPNLGYFMVNWIAGMFERLFFIINSASGPEIYANWIAPILATTAAIGGVVGLGVFAKHSKQWLERDRVLTILLFVMTCYIVALWGRNAHDYVHLGRIVAVNGRYLVLVILPFILAAAIGWQHLLARFSSRVQSTVLVVAGLLCLQGGGVISYIAYSNANWYWPHNDFALRINKDAQKFIKPTVWAPKIN